MQDCSHIAALNVRLRTGKSYHVRMLMTTVSLNRSAKLEMPILTSIVIDSGNITKSVVLDTRRNEKCEIHC